MKKLGMLAILLIALTASAAGLKVWVSGEQVTITDLNANFSHIHNVMVGGHGARLVNADVSASAGIASTKLADGPAIPKGLGYVDNGAGSACSAGTCTVANSKGTTSVVWNSTGVYYINHSTTLDTKHITLVNSLTGGGWCIALPGSTLDVVMCYVITAGAAAAADSIFTYAVFDP